MKVIVTGGTGFLGRHLVWRLAAQGADVVFTGRRQAAADLVCQHATRAVRYQHLEHGSAHAAATLAACAANADAIVHCAALSSPWGHADEFHRANVASTVEVLDACASAGVSRLVHISTPSLYFNFQDRVGVREGEPLPEPVNAYACSKGQAEQLVHRQAPCDTVILRPRALFGPWDDTLMPRLLRVMRKGPIPLMRGGRARMDLTYVDNAVDAIWLALTKPLPRRLVTYNVSNGEPIVLTDLLDAVAHAFTLPLRTRPVPWPLVKAGAGLLEAAARITGTEPPLTRYSAGVLAFSQTLDTSAIRHDLGYTVQVPLREGIRRHAQWWLTRTCEGTA